MAEANRKRHAAARQTREDRDTVSTYLEEIGRYPLMSRADESALSTRIRAGDTAAVNELVCANLRFVVVVAKKYQNRGLSLADLIEEGNVGLIRAAERFDESHGVKFISYAVWWVRQSILQALADQGHAVRVPISQAGAAHRIGRELNALSQELGRDPTQRELAIGLNLDEETIAATLPISRSALSLDAPIADGDDGTMLDYLADDEEIAPDERVTTDGVSQLLRDAMHLLRGREAEVLSLYFGLGREEPQTLESIGDRFGITRERVRQIKDKALSRLRKSKQAKLLESYR